MKVHFTRVMEEKKKPEFISEVIGEEYERWGEAFKKEVLL